MCVESWNDVTATAFRHLAPQNLERVLRLLQEVRPTRDEEAPRMPSHARAIRSSIVAASVADSIRNGLRKLYPLPAGGVR